MYYLHRYRHYYLGSYHRVPKEWDFPRCGVRDLWRQWWIGDRRRQIPPLRMVDIVDVRHIDKRPVSEQEIHGRRGLYRMNRRSATKILSDIRYIINYIKSRLALQNIGFEPNEPITLRKVNFLYAAVQNEFFVNPRDVQNSWLTVVRRLRERNRQINNEDAETDDEEDDDEL
jgi:hypothetical protein